MCERDFGRDWMAWHHVGCLAAGREDGLVEIWDLVDRSHEPIITCTVSMAVVTSLSFSLPEDKDRAASGSASHRQYLAVGRCCAASPHE